MTRDKIIARVQKLMALAGKNSNEAEATSAAEKAHELIAEHQISQAELGEKKSKIGHDDSFKTNSRPWRRYIGVALAELYFCKYHYHYERKPGKASGHDYHMFIGRPENTTIARIMFSYLCVTIDRIANHASHKKWLNEHTVPKEFKASFKLGCAFRVSLRLQEKCEAAKIKPTTTSTGTTLPALRDAYEEEARAIEEYIDQIFDRDGSNHKGRAKPKSSSGFTAGYEAGASIGLDQQVEHRQAKRLT